mgnify:CR=1 FL=1
MARCPVGDVNFNPRSREGSDTEEVFINAHRGQISIHAPARGATHSGAGDIVKKLQFQSTLPRGERPAFIKTQAPTDEFQSTLPRGERQRL